MWRKRVADAIVAGNVFSFGGMSVPTHRHKEENLIISSSSSSDEDSDNEEHQKMKSNKDPKSEENQDNKESKQSKTESDLPHIPEETEFTYTFGKSSGRKPFNADGNRNNMVFGNDLLMDKTAGAYIDTNRAVDNVMDIKTVMKKQRKNADYRKKKAGSFIDDDESDFCGIVSCIRRAKNQYDRRNIDSAISYLDAAIKHGCKELQRSRINAVESQDLLDARMLRAKCCLLKGKPKEALKESDKILKYQKKNLEAIFLKAESYYFQSKFEKALLCYHQGNRQRTPLYSQKFRLGIVKATDAIMETIQILDDPGTSLRRKDPGAKTFKSRVELVKKLNKFNAMDLDYSSTKKSFGFAETVISSTKKQMLTKKPMRRLKSSLFLEEGLGKISLNTMDTDLKRLQVERDFLDGISRAIKPKEGVISEKDARKNRLSKKKPKPPPKPKCELLQFTEDTLGYIDRRKQFWASLSINKGHSNIGDKDIKKSHR